MPAARAASAADRARTFRARRSAAPMEGDTGATYHYSRWTNLLLTIQRIGALLQEQQWPVRDPAVVQLHRFSGCVTALGGSHGHRYGRPDGHHGNTNRERARNPPPDLGHHPYPDGLQP